MTIDYIKQEADRLLDYIENCHKQLQEEMQLTIDQEKDIYLALALLGLYHAGMDQAKAVAYCVHHLLGNASRTGLRALLEIGLDIRLMLEWDDCHKNAVRYLTTADLEMKNAIDSSEIGDKSLKQKIDLDLNDYRRLFPDIVQSLQAEFQNKGFVRHWSGLSRKGRHAILEKNETPLLDKSYHFLSWDAHAKMVNYKSTFKVVDKQFTWSTIEENNPDLLLYDINSAGFIFNGISSNMFKAPIFKSNPNRNKWIQIDK
jgi:hypothetical protein